MKNYVLQILVLLVVAIFIYLLWGAEIKNFFSSRGVVDIPTFINFLYGSVVWLASKIFVFLKNVVEYILQLFNNILSNVVRIADLLAGILDILKKISSFIGGVFGIGSN